MLLSNHRRRLILQRPVVPARRRHLVPCSCAASCSVPSRPVPCRRRLLPRPRPPPYSATPAPREGSERGAPLPPHEGPARCPAFARLLRWLDPAGACLLRGSSPPSSVRPRRGTRGVVARFRRRPSGDGRRPLHQSYDLNSTEEERNSIKIKKRLKLWLFISYVVSFVSLAAAVGFLVQDALTDTGPSAWTGIAGVLQTVFVLISGLIYWTYHSED